MQLVRLSHLQRINAMLAQNSLIELVFLRGALYISFALDAFSQRQLALLKAVLFDAKGRPILDLTEQLLPILLLTVSK